VQLILIRHAETRRVEAETGPADPGLTEAGHDQARRLAGWLGETEPLDHIASSPLLRARQTAEPIGERFGLALQVVPELAEFDSGASTYIPMEEMKATGHPRLRAMLEGRWGELGDSMDPVAFRRSVVVSLDGIAAANPGQSVAVVCHGAVINAYLGDVIGTPRLLWFEPRYTSLHRVLVSRDGIRSVQSINEVVHLGAAT